MATRVRFSAAVQLLTAIGLFGCASARRTLMSNPAWVAAQAQLLEALASPSAAYSNFTRAHNRVQSSISEASLRKAVFLSNVKYSAIENESGLNSYVLGINGFSDLTYEEFAATYLVPSLGSKAEAPAPPPAPPSPTSLRRKLMSSRRKLTALAACNVDWRNSTLNPMKKNVVTSIKNQAACGSCWAFAAMAAIESNILMKGGNVTDLSEQQALNCDPYSPKSGCSNGGLATDVWSWANSNGGVATEAQLPYLAGSNTYATDGVAACTHPPVAAGSKPLTWTTLNPMNDQGLAAALLNQPVKVGLFAGPQFQNYYSGILTCSSSDSGYYSINHELQAVGCSTVKNPSGVDTLVYILKNQWGTSWGYNGFGYLQRIDTSSAYPYGNCAVGSDADWISS